MVNAHSYRWEQIARHWVTQGHQVDVITSRVRGVLNRSLDAGVNVTRVGLISKSITEPSNAIDSLGIIKKIRASIINCLRPLYRKLYWPDAWWHWIPSVVLEVFRRRFTKYDLVISYYPCMGAHFAAAALMYLTKSTALRWIADYGDPFSTSVSMSPNNFNLYSRLNMLVERRIARLADFIVFTNEETAIVYQAVFLKSEKIRVIPHLVDVKSLHAGSKSISSEIRKRKKICMFYVGAFHRGIREPFLLFELIRALNRISPDLYVLKIYGPENGFNLSPEDCKNIIYCGVVDRCAALGIVRDADILVNVENKNCVMSPSKIVEYIGTGRSIVNLSFGGIRHRALEAYVDKGCAISVSDSLIYGNDLRNVEEFLLKRSCSIAPIDMVEYLLKDFTLEHVSMKYLSICVPWNLDDGFLAVER
jgi:hypothetical protein